MVVTPVRRGFRLAELLTVFAVISTLCAILIPVLAHGAAASGTAGSCLANQQQLARTALLLADDQGAFPTAGQFWSAAGKSAKSALRCPAPGAPKGNSYGYNAYLAGVAKRALSRPAEVIITADCTADSNNVLKTPADIAPRHANDVAVYSYADGHVAQTGRQIPAFISDPGANLMADLPVGAIINGNQTTASTGKDVLLGGLGYSDTGARRDPSDINEIANVTLPSGPGKAFHMRTSMTQVSGAYFGNTWPRIYANAQSSAFVMSCYFKCRADGDPSAGFNELRCMVTNGDSEHVPQRGLMDFASLIAIFSRWDQVDMPAAYWSNPIPAGYESYSTPKDGPYFMDMFTFNHNKVLNPTGWVDPQDGVKRGELYGVVHQDTYRQQAAEDKYRSAYYAEWHPIKLQVINAEESWCDFGHGADCVKQPIPQPASEVVSEWWKPTTLSFYANGNGRLTDMYWADFRLQYL